MKTILFSILVIVTFTFVTSYSNLASAQSPGVTLGNTVNLSNDGKSSNPRIVTSGDDVYVVWENSKSGYVDIYFKKSSDGGNTFGSSINLSNNNGRSYDPRITVSGNDIYVIWSDESRINKAYANVLFVKSTDGGNTFTSPTILSSKTAFTEVTINYGEKVVSSGNNVYVAWIVGNYNWVNVFVAKSRDGGITFDDPINVSNSKDYEQIQQPDIAAAGDNAYAVWQVYNNHVGPPYGYISLAKITPNSIKTINLTKSENGFSSWEAAISAKQNNVSVLWRDENPENGITFAKSTDNGDTFTKTKLGITGLLGNTADKWIGPNDNPYIAYSDGTNAFLTKSTDGGNSFSNATKISNSTWNLNPYDDPPHPQISVSGNGVFVVWKYTVSPNGNHAPFFAASIDGGNTFSSQINLNKHSVDIIEIPQIATSGNKVYVLWTDESHHGVDIFLLMGNFTNTIKESDSPLFTQSMSGYFLFSEYLNYFVVIGIVIAVIITVFVITRLIKRK